MRSISFLLTLLLLTGCTPSRIGPQSLQCDSIKYNHALNDSTDSQLLLNIVRLRYRDTPTFLQVGVISSSYENKHTASSEFKIDGIGKTVSGTITPKLGIEQSEKPTTTYQPLKGESFVREMLSPVNLQTVMLLHSSGWKIDRILRTCVQRMNHVNNAPSASGPTPELAPEYEEFLELMDLLRDLEVKDCLDLVKAKDAKTGKVGYLLMLDTNRADSRILNRIWQILNVDAGTDQIRVVAYHGQQHSSDEIVLDMRSPISVMYFLSHGVHIPERDQFRGKVTITQGTRGAFFNWDDVLGGVMAIHSGPLCSREAAICINYRGSNFYIDDSDLGSKSTFAMLTQILALQTGCPDLLPTLTIPIN